MMDPSVAGTDAVSDTTDAIIVVEATRVEELPERAPAGFARSARDDRPRRVYRVEAVQTTPSMGGVVSGDATRLDIAKAVARGELLEAGKKPGSKCGVVEFGEDAHAIVMRQATTAWSAHTTVDGLSCRASAGPADLASALDACLDLVEGLPEDIKVECRVISGGDVWIDVRRLEEIAEDLRDLDVSVHLIDVSGADVSDALITAAAILARYVRVKVMPLPKCTWAVTSLRTAVERAAGGQTDCLAAYLLRAFTAVPEVVRVPVVAAGAPLAFPLPALIAC